MADPSDHKVAENANDDGSPRPEGSGHGAHGSPFAALPTLACLVSSSGMTTV